MCEAFQITAAEHADVVALRTPGGAVELTYAEYADRVRAIAAGLYAITPWAIHYARAGWEPAAFLPFTLGGIALLWAGLRDHHLRDLYRSLL